MAQQIGEDTKVTLDLKTIGMAATGLGVLISMWFALQADIAEAKELPEPLAPEITRMEFDMKDQLVPVSYTHPPSPRDATLSRMPSSA